MKIKIILPILVMLLVFSCAKEFDRFEFTNLNTIEKEIIITEDKPIELWVDLKVHYTGVFSLFYDITLLKDNEVILTKSCDAMNVNVKIYSSEVHINDNHKIKYQGKLSFKTEKLQKGNYKLIITPKAQGNTDELFKYDIIIKQ